MIIRLPIKPGIKKFLIAQFGENMFLTEKNYFCMMVVSMLEKFEKGNPVVQRPNNKMIDGDKYVGYNVQLSDYLLNKKGGYISNENIRLLNEALENMIRRQMYDWIQSPAKTHKEVDYNIHAFRDLYGIFEDEMPFDNLKRWYYRERERRDKYKSPKVDTILVIEYDYDVEEVIDDRQMVMF